MKGCIIPYYHCLCMSSLAAYTFLIFMVKNTGINFIPTNVRSNQQLGTLSIKANVNLNPACMGNSSKS